VCAGKPEEFHLGDNHSSSPGAGGDKLLECEVMAAVPAPVPPLANAPGPGLVPGPPIPAHAAIPPPPPIPPPPLPADEDVNIPEPPLPWEMQPLGGIVDALRYGLTVPNPPVDFYDFDTLDSIADRLWGPVESAPKLSQSQQTIN